jgi:hypothetical protein
MKNDVCGHDDIACRHAAIFEAMRMDRATVMFQTVWHRGASVLFEEIKRFNNRVQNAGAAASGESMAARSGEISCGIRTGGVTWDTH